jgi:cyclic pyranopterin monophosphate synthase
MIDAPGGMSERGSSIASDANRSAVAVGRVEMDRETLGRIRDGRVVKGDVLGTARIAGVIGAKQTSRLIPLCLDVHLTAIELDIEIDEEASAISIQAFAKSRGSTGVEMEALTAVSVAALTIYDMCKSQSRQITITDIHLLAKTGGQSGDYLRESAAAFQH